MNCGQCTETILDQIDLITCSGENCKLKYHYGCAGISQSMFRKMTSTHKEEWKCLKCKTVKKSEVAKNTRESEEGKSSDNFMKFMEDVSRQLKILPGLKEDLEKIKKDNEEVIKSQNFISEQYEEIIKKLDCLPKLEKKVEQLQSMVQQKDEEIKVLSTRLNQLEQYGRNKNIEINEVTEESNEDLEGIVVTLANKMGVAITGDDIEVAHRLPKTRRENRPATIIVQFARRKKRDEVLAAKKKVVTNNQVTGLKGGRIYVSENLSFYYRNLLREAKKKGRDLGYKFIWFKNGSVKLRKDENGSVIVVNDVSDFVNIK